MHQMVENGLVPGIKHPACFQLRFQGMRTKSAERDGEKTKRRPNSEKRDSVHFPPKNFRNDWKSRPGSVVAFWPRSWIFWANCVWVPPWISQATVGTLSFGKVIS